MSIVSGDSQLAGVKDLSKDRGWLGPLCAKRSHVPEGSSRIKERKQEKVVPPAGIEPALPKERDFESRASTSSARGATDTEVREYHRPRADASRDTPQIRKLSTIISKGRLKSALT